MKNNQLIIIIVFLLTLSFLNPNLALANNELSQAEEIEPVTVEIEGNNLEAKEINNIIKDEEYQVLQIEGEIEVGTEKVTDNLIKVKGENLAELEKEITDQRELLLLNLKNTEELGKENKSKKEKEKKIKDIEKAITENKKVKKNIKKIKATYETEEKANKTIERQKNNKKIKKMEKQVKKVEEKENKEETKQEKINKNIEKLKMSLLKEIKPLKEVYAQGTGWIPNYVDIAFYDTDEVGIWPLEWWKDTSNAKTNQRPDATNLWWRTYIIHQGTDGYPYLGKFRDEGAKDFEGWRKLDFPYVKEDRDHSIASQTDWLWHTTRSTKTNKIYIRRSSDGGNTWTTFKDLGIRSSTAVDMINHGGNNLCIVYKGDINQNVYVGCSNDWMVKSESWRWRQLVGIQTSIQPSIASSFGTLWIGHRGNDRKVYVQSSYDNGNSWNGVEHIRGGMTDSPIGLAGIGKSEWKNERLCVIIRSRADRGMIEHSCLYRYGETYNSWNYHPWMKQQGLTNDGPVVTSDTSRMIQVHRTLDNKIQTRALQWANPGGRGYVSNMMWKKPSFTNNQGYEPDISLYNHSSENYKTYITKADSGWASCMPYVRYWSSNLPDPYLDTRYDTNNKCDSNNENKWTSYTIGSAKATQIKANQYYFTYWHGDKGENVRPIFAYTMDLTLKEAWRCVYICQGNAWHFFGKEAIVIHSKQDNVIINQDPVKDRGINYPYWYKRLKNN